MATIKAIEGRTVHQIQSGQVIVDICSVVKELVENSLDAGATSIDVRFKNQGLDSIEVQDNGGGISPQNYETIALKHYTSKLSTYADLTTLQTFGFRGEALSSLCALSRFSIITCMAQDVPKGTKLEFEISGALKGTSVVAAQKGTTVIVENLFSNLPVRRRELERNIKREWGRVVGVLGQYACIQTGIKFSVTQLPTKGKKTTLFSTKGNQTTKENIVNVFGAKTLAALVHLDLNLNLELSSGPGRKFSIQENEGKKHIRIVGHISRPAYGEGRQTPDRQMFFVNTRPCGLPQVAKAFNEVYKSYNSSQSPFIFANIELDTHMYDVNVSPDKRTILLHDQTAMLENLKEALTALFESQDYTVPISRLPAQKQPSYKQLTISRESTARTETSQTPTESTDVEESEEDSSTSSREHSTDEEGSRTLSNDRIRRSTTTRQSLSRDHRTGSITSSSISRKPEDRGDQKLHFSEALTAVPENLSKEEKATTEKLEKDSQQQQAISKTPEAAADSVATTTSSHSVSSDDSAVSLSPDRIESCMPRDDDQDPIVEVTETQIPALQSPPKSSAAVSVFSSNKRAQRVLPDVATISIGDHTVTSSIGTPCPKRPRIENSTTVSHYKGGLEALDVPLPSFGSRLSQRFAATGTQSVLQDAEDTEAESEVENDSPHTVGSLSQDRSDVVNIEELDEPDVVKEKVDSILPNQRLDQDEEYIDEDEKKSREEVKVQEMIKAAEESSAHLSQENALRAKALLKGGSNKKDTIVSLVRVMETSVSEIGEQLRRLNLVMDSYQQLPGASSEDEVLDSDAAEEKLSLTILKTDFAKMKIIGQFNLGFILASRASKFESEAKSSAGDELFIIDQHASDEKYNFERLQATTIVQSQRLVYPKTLSLTAMEEEVVIENLQALETNGFLVTVDQTGKAPVGQRCQLVSLPLSRETAFAITDLEELLVLLAESPPGSVPRPSKVRRMFAMRACRSSIMIGRTLTNKQMGKVVKHLGELDKPWNCPHGRPTMRHLCGLSVWDALGWKEDDGLEDRSSATANWAAYVRQNKDDVSSTASP